MSPSLATLRAMPLLAASQSGNTDNIKFWLYFSAFAVLVICFLATIRLLVWPSKPKFDLDRPPSASVGDSGMLLIVVAAAFALLVIFLIKFAEADGSGFGGR